MKDKCLLVLVGIPGSGKSTWAKEFLEDSRKGIIISRDAIRFSMLKDTDNYFRYEREVFAEYINQLNTSLHNDEYDWVIADATHISAASRQKLFNNLEVPENVQVVYAVFTTALNTCIERNKNRTGRSHVPTTAIVNMYNTMSDPALDKSLGKAHVVYIGEDETELTKYE